MDKQERKRERFLESLAEYGNVKHACLSAGIGRTRVYQWRKEDEAFAASSWPYTNIRVTRGKVACANRRVVVRLDRCVEQRQLLRSIARVLRSAGECADRLEPALVSHR